MVHTHTHTHTDTLEHDDINMTHTHTHTRSWSILWSVKICQEVCSFVLSSLTNKLFIYQIFLAINPPNPEWLDRWTRNQTRPELGETRE